MSDIQNWNTAAGSGYQFVTEPPDGFPENKLPSVTNNVVREVMASKKRRYADSNGSIVATGSAGAYAITTSETIAAHDGLVIGFQANHTNTGAATLNRNGAGAADLRKDYNVELKAGDIQSGQKVLCIYDATNSWYQVLSVRSNSGRVLIDTFTGTGAQTAFILTEDPGTKNNVEVYISGIYQHAATYAVSGTTLTFTEAPPNGAEIDVRLIAPAAATAIADDEVTLAKMAAGTAGGVIVYDASGDPADLGAGATGQVVQSNGPGAAPTWGFGVPTGVWFPYVGGTAPSGYVLASGRTIGSAASGATERANADCEALFKLLWNSWADNEAPVTGGRGASADADWAANKVIAVVDLRGRNSVGLDNMGGGAAGRITSASDGGANATTPGGAIGGETQTLDVSQMPAHSHDMDETATFDAGGFGRAVTGGANPDEQTGTAGGGQPHSNTQPGLMATVIVKL